MPKKKRKGLLKHTLSKSEAKMVDILSIVHSTDGSKLLAGNSNLIDSDFALEPSRVAALIEKQFKTGSPPEDIAYFQYNVLTDVLSHLQVPGRSDAKTKIEKAELLYKFFMGDVEPVRKRKEETTKSKSKTKKSSQTPVWRRQ